MVINVAIVIHVQVQNKGFGSTHGNEFLAEGLHELIGVLYQRSREAIHSEVDSGEVFDCGVVCEDAEVCSWSKG
jgi:hypothetical protein